MNRETTQEASKSTAPKSSAQLARSTDEASSHAGVQQQTASSLLLRLQRTHGNNFVQRFLKRGGLQRGCACGGSCGPCTAAHDDEAQRHAGGEASADSSEAPPIVHEVLRSSGQPLDAPARSYMEQRFGANFEQVRVHTGTKAAESASAVGALAYTVGQNVVFGEGQYAPETENGRMILAHELAHTIQQGGDAHTPPPDRLEVSHPDDAAEQEADQIAHAVTGNMNASALLIGAHAPDLALSGLAAQTAPIAARACDAAKEAEKMTACIQPYVIADDDGKNPTAAPSFTETKDIWAKCCIDYTIKATKTICKTAYKTLEESPNNTPSAEETSLFADAGASTCIQVFVPQQFSQGAKTGKDISGGGGTYDAGKANPKIVVVEGAVGEVVAHEVGHASGYLGHDGNTTVMKPTGAYNVANSSNVSADVCTKARSGSVLTKGATKDCCMTY